jgi:iron complex outermembrane recepter protein
MESTTASRGRRRLSQAITLALGLTALTALSQTIAFNVPGQDAATAIPEFARQAGLQIIAPADKLKGIMTHSLHGAIDTRAALKLLLEGTGLIVASDDGHTISLRFPEGAGNTTSTVTPAVGAGQPAGPADAQQAAAAPTAGTLDDIIVTANRREEGLQSVPLSITAINNAEMEQLHIQDFNDYAKLLPSVSFQAQAPGFAHVLIRGVSSDANANHSGPQPTVGTYLDDQPITTIQGALDLHLYDIARIEELSGPQGTLYGASSEAGTVRIITNKPELGVFKAAYAVEGNVVSHGGPGGTVEGFVNLPLGDAAALRLVAWKQHKSGYIDNILATRTFSTQGGTISNAAFAEKHYNDVDITGGRAALKIDLNDSWTVTPVVIAQDTKTKGVFGYDPALGDLKTERFSPDDSDDYFVDSALTIEGKISNFDITYTGAYLKRDTAVHTDYSDYTLAYQGSPSYASLWVGPHGTTINPAQQERNKGRYEMISHELRFTSPKEYPLRAVGGLFYQRQQHQIESNFVIPGVDPTYTVTGWPDTWWLTEEMRVDRDQAAFAELSYDLTSKFTVTGGLRHFKYDNSLEGFTGYGLNNPLGIPSGPGQASPSCVPPGVYGGPCLSFDKSVADTGNTFKLNFNYKIDDSKLVYATWSKGFRPGGINRVGTLPPYQADFLTNVEIGWKMTFAGTFRWNGAVFRENWTNFQYQFLGSNSLTRIANAGAAEILGLESNLSWAVTPNLTLTTGFTLMNPQLKGNYCNRLNPDGSPMTSNPCLKPNSNPALPPTPYAPLAPDGQQLPSTSKFKGNMTARYLFPLGDWQGHVGGSLVYQTQEWPDLRTRQRTALGVQPGFATEDLSFGGERGNYNLDLYVINVLDERGQIFRYSTCGSCSSVANYAVPTQPRTVGVRFGQKF